MAQPTPAKPLAAELQSGKAPETTADDQNKPPVTEEPSETLDSSWDFTPEELAAEPTEFVSIGLGKYQVRSGDEFNVKVTLKGPPLQAAVLALVFDRSVVEPVPDSGAAVGSVFRKGVEFFIHPTEGRAALFCATQPGKKNVLGARDEVVASFRMRAKAAGKTTISADDKGLKFVGGSGTEIRSEVLAGEVTVTP